MLLAVVDDFVETAAGFILTPQSAERQTLIEYFVGFRIVIVLCGGRLQITG